MKRWGLVLRAGFFLAFFCSAPHAEDIRVAFYESRLPNGEPVQLEPGGRFGHVAISYNNGWIQALPRQVVEWQKNLPSVMGYFPEILIKRDAPELDYREVNQSIGLEFDIFSDWDNPKTTYCTKLVAKLLQINPAPMPFEGAFWSKLNVPRGKLGLSPDDLHEILMSQGFEIEYASAPLANCQKKLIRRQRP